MLLIKIQIDYSGKWLQSTHHNRKYKTKWHRKKYPNSHVQTKCPHLTHHNIVINWSSYTYLYSTKHFIFLVKFLGGHSSNCQLFLFVRILVAVHITSSWNFSQKKYQSIWHHSLLMNNFFQTVNFWVSMIWFILNSMSFIFTHVLPMLVINFI